MITAALLALALAAQDELRNPRRWAGDWYVSDTTDNTTGEREVYAFQSHVTRSEYVSLKMRCSERKPTFFVEWDDLPLPKVAVISIEPLTGPETPSEDVRYVFEKSDDVVERGHRATPDVSKKIVSAIGRAPTLMLTAHLASGSRSLVFNVAGTQQAWDRVVRHCPAPKMPLPPI